MSLIYYITWNVMTTKILINDFSHPFGLSKSNFPSTSHKLSPNGDSKDSKSETSYDYVSSENEVESDTIYEDGELSNSVMRREAAHRLGTSKNNLRWSERGDGQYVRADQDTPPSVKALEPSTSPESRSPSGS